MKYVLYEITDEYDVVIKLTFLKHSWLVRFIEQHTDDKKYVPKFLVLELDDNNDIDFISEYKGKQITSRKCVAEYIE